MSGSKRDCRLFRSDNDRCIFIVKRATAVAKRSHIKYIQAFRWPTSKTQSCPVDDFPHIEYSRVLKKKKKKGDTARSYGIMDVYFANEKPIPILPEFG